MVDERFRTITRIRGGGRDMRPFLLAFAVSVICHLALVVVIIFASEYNPRPIPPASVINVSMISFPDEPAGPGESDSTEAEPAPEPEPAPPDLAAEELEQLLMRQENRPEPEPIPEPVSTPEPEPEPEPAAEAPEPEPVQLTPPAPAREQVVIDPEEPREKPEPKPPVQAQKPERPAETKKPAPAPDKDKDRDETDAPPPQKTVRYKKPARIAKPEVTDKGRGAVKQAIEDIQKRLASRDSSSASRGSSSDGGRGAGGSGGAGTGTMGIQARMAIKSYAGSVLPDRINRNWAFSERLSGGRSDLAAVLVISIGSGGKITDIRFERRSGNRYFDDSVYKAVIKSDPLPPLPKAYTDYENSYTVGLRFTPSGLN